MNTQQIVIKINVFDADREDAEWFAEHACCALDHMLSVADKIRMNGAAVYFIKEDEE